MMRLRGLTAMAGLIAALTLMCTGGAALADYPDAVLADNPLGYWRLNETSTDIAANLGSGGDLMEGFYIDGVQGAPGPTQLADGTPVPGFGAGNVAFQVGPDESYMSVEQPILSGLDQFTVSGWIQPGLLDGDRVGLFGQNDVVELGFISPTTLQFWTPRGTVNHDFSSTEVAEGAWTHVAAVGRPGSVQELYVNGEPVARNSFEFNIGGGGIWDRIDQNNGNQFEGTLDEVAIWNVALTDAQFKAHYDAAVTPGGDYSAAVLADNPMGYWRLNETTGTTAANIGTDGASLDGNYNAGEQGAPGPDLPGMGANNVAYAVGMNGEQSFVNVPASPLSNLEEFSMSGWMQAEPRFDNRIGLWGQNDVIEFGFIEPEVLNVWTPSSSMGNWNIFDDPDLGDKIDDGQWVHLGMAGDANGIRLYVDGELVAEGTTPFDSSTGENFGSSEFFFNAGGGGIFDDVGNQFTGTVDEIAMWDTALTREQIRLQFEAALGGVLVPVLMAGDADQNLQFDQLDLVKVQIAAKYLTGEAATWGEGDWDGAPGGTVGDPPPGNGLFDQLDIVAALNGNQYLKGPYFPALTGPGQEGDGQTSIIYDPRTGELGVDAPAGAELTSINIDSASGIFTGDPAANLGGSFDHDADDNIFKATFGSSFGSLSFGNVAAAGLSEEFVTNDLSAVGSLAGGGDLGDVDLIYVPEPSTLAMLGIALFAVLAVRIGRRK